MYCSRELQSGLTCHDTSWTQVDAGEKEYPNSESMCFAGCWQQLQPAFRSGHPYIPCQQRPGMNSGENLLTVSLCIHLGRNCFHMGCILEENWYLPAFLPSHPHKSILEACGLRSKKPYKHIFRIYFCNYGIHTCSLFLVCFPILRIKVQQFVSRCESKLNSLF